MFKYKIIQLFALVISLSSFAQTAKQYEYQYIDVEGYVMKSYLLTIPNESIFIIKDDRKSGTNMTQEGVPYKVYTDKWATIYYQSKTQNLTRIPIYSKELIYESKDIIQEINLSENKKVIGKYKCQEATIKKGGRIYTAWFTSEVPLKTGPINIVGIPGLIVELSEKNSKSFKISLTSISDLKDLTEFNAYKKYVTSKKHLNLTDYNATVTKLLTNVKRENYSILAKMNATMEYTEDQGYFTKHLVDIPKNLVSELQKIKQ
ncbi:GLPGLI, GLPGLI family protein [Spirosomataceae bacterium]|jgi:GLPGLI family protein